jgi:hypothetical protein
MRDGRGFKSYVSLVAPSTGFGCDKFLFGWRKDRCGSFRVDEFDPGLFESSPNGLIIGPGERGRARHQFGARRRGALG